jgi:hypothetical protein
LFFTPLKGVFFSMPLDGTELSDRFSGARH